MECTDCRLPEGNYNAHKHYKSGVNFALFFYIWLYILLIDFGVFKETRLTQIFSQKNESITNKKSWGAIIRKTK